MKDQSLLRMAHTVVTCDHFAETCKESKPIYVLMKQTVRNVFAVVQNEGDTERFKEVLLKYVTERQKLVDLVVERHTPEALTKSADELFDHLYKVYGGDSQ